MDCGFGAVCICLKAVAKTSNFWIYPVNAVNHFICIFWLFGLFKMLCVVTNLLNIIARTCCHFSKHWPYFSITFYRVHQTMLIQEGCKIIEIITTGSSSLHFMSEWQTQTSSQNFLSFRIMNLLIPQGNGGKNIFKSLNLKQF